MRERSSGPSSIPILAGAAALPVLVWWLGWHPGFASSDTIDQFGQIAMGTFYDHHPAIHTLYLAGLSLGGSRPGIVTLLQVLALGVLLAYSARWLVAAGVPGWLTVAAAWALGLSPAIAPTTLALWKDVPFALALVWAWVELLALGVDPGRARRPWPAVRLGAALAGVWLLRANGPLTVVLVLAALAIVHRSRLRQPAVVGATGAAIVLIVTGPVYAIAGVQGSGIGRTDVFLADVAASFNDRPDTFTEEDLALMQAVAPLDVWTGRYSCHDSTALVFAPEFDLAAVRANPEAWWALERRVIIRDPGSVLAHRACTASFLFVPAQPGEAYFHRPPYDIPPNTLGLARSPISDRAFEITDRRWRWAEVDERLWLTWRPAIVLLPALAAVGVFAVLPRARRFLLPSSVLVAHTLNVAATSPAQEFRYAFPVYLLAVLTLTLLWPALVRSESPEVVQMVHDRS
jgi:hypothetical protein